MAQSGPCVGAEPGGSQELGTRTSHTCFPHKVEAQTHITFAKMHIIQIALYAAFGTGTADHRSLL